MRFGKYNIKKKLITDYIQHFDTSKKNLWDWERKRKKLHEALFNSVGVKRISDNGRKLSDEIDKYCIPLIEKLDYFVAGLKKIGIAKDEGEIKQAGLDLQNMRMLEQLQKDKANHKAGLKESTGRCRRCNKDLNKVSGRVNDHLVTGLDANPVNDPICMHCTQYNPDEYFEEFRRKYWS